MEKLDSALIGEPSPVAAVTYPDPVEPGKTSGKGSSPPRSWLVATRTRFLVVVTGVEVNVVSRSKYNPLASFTVNGNRPNISNPSNGGANNLLPTRAYWSKGALLVVLRYTTSPPVCKAS